MPISSPVSSKIVFAPSATRRSNATPIAGFAVSPDVASEPPQIVPTVSSSMPIGTGCWRASSRQRLLDPLAARGDGLARAAGVLDAEREHRPAGGLDRAREPALVEALAAERDEQRGADVGMRAQLLHHPERVRVRVAAGEADQVDAALAKRRDDLARDVVRALDEVGDDEDVADALAAVGAEVALQHRAQASCAQAGSVYVGR